VRKKIESLLPAIAKASIGDFSDKIEVPDEKDEFTELAAGLRMMMEDLEYHLTELRRVEEERVRVSVTAAILEAIVDMIVVLDLEGRVVHVNNAWLQMFGLELKDVCGRMITEIPGVRTQRPGYAKRFMTFIGEAAEGNRVNPEDMVVVAKDGREVFVSIVGGTMKDDRGRPTHMVLVLRDVTEQRKAEDKLRKTIEDMKRFNRLAVGRELKMIELKKEVDNLLLSMGRQEKYETHMSD
jgi:PAS domain S-box-containing protein